VQGTSLVAVRAATPGRCPYLGLGIRPPRRTGATWCARTRSSCRTRRTCRSCPACC
jgi:hypothetical protein